MLIIQMLGFIMICKDMKMQLCGRHVENYRTLAPPNTFPCTAGYDSGCMREQRFKKLGRSMDRSCFYAVIFGFGAGTVLQWFTADIRKEQGSVQRFPVALFPL
jgi:hypothetical protein